MAKQNEWHSTTIYYIHLQGRTYNITPKINALLLYKTVRCPLIEQSHIL